jgi:hypothetical protein
MNFDASHEFQIFAVPHLLDRLGLTLQLSYTLHQVLREFNQPPSVSDHRRHDRLILAAAMIIQSDGVKFFVGHHITSPL